MNAQGRTVGGSDNGKSYRGKLNGTKGNDVLLFGGGSGAATPPPNFSLCGAVRPGTLWVSHSATQTVSNQANLVSLTVWWGWQAAPNFPLQIVVE